MRLIEEEFLFGGGAEVGMSQKKTLFTGGGGVSPIQ